MMTVQKRDWRSALTDRERDQLQKVEGLIAAQADKLARLRAERRRIQNTASARSARARGA